MSAILGVGIDLIEIARIQSSLDRFGEKFLDRIFLPSEIEYCQRMKLPARHLAGRFAAKEAVSKAFGTGLGRELGWKDIEVVRTESGQPQIIFHGRGKELAERRGVRFSHLSLTHHESSAMAIVILCRD